MTRETKHIERIKKELSFMRREADRLEDFEAADALHRSINMILEQLDDLDLRQLPATDELPQAA